MIAPSGTRFCRVRSTAAAWIAVVAISCSIDTRGHTHSAGTHPPGQERLTVFRVLDAETDADGQFSWDSAAEAPFMVHVRADGFPEADEAVEAGARFNVIRLRSFTEIRVTGSVVDAETRQPLPDFQVLTSTKRSAEAGGWRMYRKAALGANGSFALTLRDSFPQNGTVVQKVGDNQKIVRYVVAIKIQAAGYVPDTSQTVAIENGDATVGIALVRGEGMSGKVTLPTGEPVPGAKVILCSGREAHMNRPGHIAAANDETQEIITDSSGRFRFVPQQNARALVVVHDKGFGLVPADRLTVPASVVLAPWGRIEGTLRVGRQPVPNATIMLVGSLPDATLPAVTLGLRAQTDEEGRFAFTQVPRGSFGLSRWQKLGERGAALLSLSSVAAEAGVPPTNEQVHPARGCAQEASSPLKRQ